MHPEAIFVSLPLNGKPLPARVHMGVELSSITGIVDYQDGRFTLRPLSPPTITFVPPALTKVALPVLDGIPVNAAGCEAIVVASYNTNKMSDQIRTVGVAMHIVKYLHNPAVVFLQEVQPASWSRGGMATTLDRLCREIERISHVTYRWAAVVDLAPNHSVSTKPPGESLQARGHNPRDVQLTDASSHLRLMKGCKHATRSSTIPNWSSLSNPSEEKGCPGSPPGQKRSRGGTSMP